MSGVWGGWLRRMRKGETAEQKAEAEATQPSDQEQAAAKLKDFDETEVLLDEATNDDAFTDPESPLADDEEPPIETTEEETTANAGDRYDLLASGRLAKAQAASRAGSSDDEVAALIEAVAQGEIVLRQAGLQMRTESAGVLKGVMLAPAAPRSAASDPTQQPLVVVFGNDNGGYCIPRTLLGPARPHLLFIADPSNTLAMLGIKRLGKSYDDCLIALLAIAGKVSATRVFCLGAGNAAYSALRFGLDLGADGVLALGTLTSLSSDAEPPGNRTPQRFTQLLRLVDELGADLHQAYATAQQQPGVVLCRSPDATGPDGGLGCLEGVTVHEAPEEAADLLAWAEAEDRLAPMLRETMACEPLFRKKTSGTVARAVS